MLEGTFIYAIVSLFVGFPSYVTGWLLLRLRGREVESLGTWWSRVVWPKQSQATRTAFLKYDENGREILTAEYAYRVGCLIWVCLIVFIPLGVAFVYSVFS